MTLQKFSFSGQRYRLLMMFSIAVLLSGCTSMKRFAYDGYKRDEWQQPDKVVETLQLNSGDTVADLGSGGGYFTFRFADAVGETGTVYAVDVDKGLLEYVEKTAAEKGYHNIKTLRASVEDSGLTPGSVNLIFVCNTFHHLHDRERYFANLKPALQSGGRVAIIEYTSGWLNSIGHGTPTEQVVAEMQAAGYQLQVQFDFLERQNFLIFQAAD